MLSPISWCVQHVCLCGEGKVDRPEMLSANGQHKQDYAQQQCVQRERYFLKWTYFMFQCFSLVFGVVVMLLLFAIQYYF